MMNPADGQPPSGTSRPRGMNSYRGEILMAAVVVAAAVVFFYQPWNGGAWRLTSAHEPESPPRSASLAVEAERYDTNFVDPTVTAASELAEREAARALALSGPVLSPAAVPDSLSVAPAILAEHQYLCVQRATAVVSSGGQGTGMASVDHAGMAGDSLAFDGPARSSTGRKMVWRCTVPTNLGSPGRMNFIPADSVPGLVLEWNAVATLDDYVLRRCIVRAQSLTDKQVRPRVSVRRRDDQVRLQGSAEGDGVSMNWSCEVTVHGDSIVSLAARMGG